MSGPLLDGNWGIAVVNTLANEDGTVEVGQKQVKYLEDDDIIPVYFLREDKGWKRPYTFYPYFMLSIPGYQAGRGFLTYDLVDSNPICLDRDICKPVEYWKWRKLKTTFLLRITY